MASIDILSQLKAATKKPAEHLPAAFYADLPITLMSACEAIDDLTSRETFLHGALPVIGSLMPNVWIPTATDRMAPTLMVYVFKPSGGGKGMAAMALRLLDKTRSNNERRMAEESRTHDRALEAWDKESEFPPPAPPYLHDVRLSMRTTTVTLTKRIERNKGRVLLADTEADAARTSSREWGSVREIIKKGFHGETADLLFKEAGKVEVDLWLSVMLTSTSDQLKGFISSPEDGLFNRFLFHTFKTDPKWKDQRPKAGKRPLSDIISERGERLAVMYNFLDGHDDIEIYFTSKQWDDHGELMSPLLDEDVAVDRKLEGYVNRLGQMILRTAVIFTVLRGFENGQLSHGTLVDEKSWRAAKSLLPIWWSNALEAYSLYAPEERPKDENIGADNKERIKDLVGRWRMEEGIKPKEAAARLTASPEEWIRIWIRENGADRAKICRLQLQYAAGQEQKLKDATNE